MHPMCSVDSCATLSGAGLDRNRSSICASLGPWLMRENMENPVPCSRTQASYLLGTRHGWTMWAAWKDFTSNLSNILYNIFLLYLYNTYIYIINILYYMRYKYYIIIYNIIYICHWFNLSLFFHMFLVAPISSVVRTRVACRGREVHHL